MHVRRRALPRPTASPTFWINDASRALMRRFDERLSSIGLSMATLRVTEVLAEHGPQNQRSLLAHVAIEQPTMTALLSRMERDGLVSRKEHPGDARSRIVSLTRRGASTYRRAHPALLEVVEVALRGVSDEERATLTRVLSRVVSNLAEPRAPGASR